MKQWAEVQYHPDSPLRIFSGGAASTIVLLFVCELSRVHWIDPRRAPQTVDEDVAAAR